MPENTSTMTFGDPSDFALEVGVDRHIDRYVRVQIWCGGVALGDVTKDVCEISTLRGKIAWLSQHPIEPWDEKLTGLNDEETWTFLDQIIFNFDSIAQPEDDRTLDDFICDFARFDRFMFIKEWGQKSKPIKAFLVNQPSKSLRILSRQFRPDVGVSVDVSRTGIQDGMGVIRRVAGYATRCISQHPSMGAR